MAAGLLRAPQMVKRSDGAGVVGGNPRRERWNAPRGCLLTRQDLRLFHRGLHFRLYEKLGSHVVSVDGAKGVSFAVWAPAAKSVSVVGDFNAWEPDEHPLQRVGRSGIWAGFVEGAAAGSHYKYRVASQVSNYVVTKSDPFAFRCEKPPGNASIVWEMNHPWRDRLWVTQRARRNAGAAPVSIYECHLGSWRRPADDRKRMLGYRELASELVAHLKQMAFTHVEFLPPKEHPFYGSWGYQSTGYFAATNRYGTPQDLMHLIDELHQNDIGVILDWVPSHFPSDEHGLGFFDGTRLFEYPDPRLGYHPDWKSYIFNYGRNEVRSFLISSALFWLDRYHVDALRVDAVASMLYLDYSRADGEWIANKHGGNENLEAIHFLRSLNDAIHERFPGVVTIAEESTTWPMVSKPTHIGGLGFDMKWDMGWMHDTLEYMSLDPIHRKFHHDTLTFRMVYAHSENFVLPLSHDEVVHGKGSLLQKMPGDTWQRFANLRSMLGYMFAQPGKKLLFMGSEIGPWREWDHERGLEWELLDLPLHAGLMRWVGDLNRAYRDLPALHRSDFSSSGFRWIDCKDSDQSVVAFTRHADETATEGAIVAVFNFTPVPRHDYRVGLPAGGAWRELLNSDAEAYGGSGQGNLGSVEAIPMRYHDLAHSALFTLPPLSAILLERKPEE
jgi:1,4-alpha-glucan branching enzyme